MHNEYNLMDQYPDVFDIKKTKLVFYVFNVFWQVLEQKHTSGT